MRKLGISLLASFFALALLSATPVRALDTINYGDLTLSAPWTTWHGEHVWDLTRGDLWLNYTVDMTGLIQPGTWDTFESWQTSYTEVGLRGEGAGDFNPGPWDTYQGNCGGWMVSDCDVWNDGDGLTEKGVPKDSTQDLDDKHALQASGGRGERDYDVLWSDPDTVGPTRQDPWYPGDPTKVIGAYGSFNNVGIWWDRDGVDPWQSTTYANTLGLYNISILYHAIDADGDGDKTDDGLGVMFAWINDLPQGFYADPANWDGTPEYIPAGLSFKGDMEHMQVFAGIWSPSDPAGHDYGDIILSDITVAGVLGVSDPLAPDFTFSLLPANTVQFTDATHGGMPPYSYSWDFNDDGIEDSIEPNPTYAYGAPGTYTVTLTVTPYRCLPKSVTKDVTVPPPQVIPEVPLGAIAAGVSMLIAIGAYVGLRRRRTVAPQ